MASEAKPKKRGRGRPRQWSTGPWATVKLPSSVVGRLDEIRAPLGLSRARMMQQLVVGPEVIPDMTQDEFKTCLNEAVRKGGIGAMRLWSELYGKDEPPETVDPFDEVRDERLKVIRGEEAA